MTSPQNDPNPPNSQSIQADSGDALEGLPRTFEHYLLLKRIAKGGMGEVFLATSAGAIEGAERPCVVKVIRREHAEDSSFLARFLDEARIQAQLEHPGVVRVLLASHDEGGKPYVVLEHVEGRNLSEVRLRVQQLGVKLAWPDAVAMAIALTEALAHIHERTDALGRPLAIVHRDLSPQNVMVGYAGDVKVIDFGTARGHNRRCHTVAGIVFAKPGYVAPEVANNQQGGIPADLYAVGVMLWELLAGRRFIAGDAAEHLAAVAAGTKVITPIAAAIGAPPELDAICQRLTATRIEDRFESATEASHELAQLLKRAPSTADGQRSVRVRIAQLMQRLYPAEPTRTRAEFQRLLAGARRIEPPVSSLVPSPSPPAAEVEKSSVELLPGTRYQLGAPIGEGSSSIVYDALHIDLGRRVALKLFVSPAESQALEAFRNEARNVAQLNHDNIVKVHDFGLTEDGKAYLSMERLEGETMDRQLKQQGQLEVRSALLLTLQICRALETAHAAGIVHGDLKPGNLFLTRTGTVKLLDFGVSALCRDQRLHQTQSESFKLVGTPEYMAPEQVRGAPASVQADLYALGTVLYELLTGTRPYESDSLGVMLGCKLDGHVDAPSLRAPLGRLPKAVDKLCLRLLASKPEQRFQSAAELKTVIEHALDGLAAGQRRASRRLRRTAGAAVLTLGAMAALTLLPEVRHEVSSMVQVTQQRLSGVFTRLEMPVLRQGLRAAESRALAAVQTAKSRILEHADPSRVTPSTPEQPPAVALAEVPSALDTPTPAEPKIDAVATVVAARNGHAEEAESSPAQAPESTLEDAKADTRAANNTALAEVVKAVDDNKPLRALDIARHASRAERRSPELLRQWVTAAIATRAWGEARRVAKELTQIEPSAENRLRLAHLERRTGHSEDARKTLDRLLAEDPNHAEARALKAKLEPNERVAAR